MIEWSDSQRQRVDAAVEAHPAESGRCALAAQEILPVAHELDEAAHAIVIEPLEGIYVLAKGHERWFHHVTVWVSEHCVDALTGARGHPEGTYLPTYFEFPDELAARPVEDHEWGEL